MPTTPPTTQEIINEHYSIHEQFYGFNLREASEDNFTRIMRLLANEEEVLLNMRWESTPNPYVVEALGQPGLTVAENELMHLLTTSFTLKHATSALPAIINEGCMKPVRTIAASGAAKNRHTTSANCADRSIYFTFGIGDHRTPSFLNNNATDTITIDLATLKKQDPQAVERLWVSTHITEYELQTRFDHRIGTVDFCIQHDSSRFKTYIFRYYSGEILHWNVSYQDEVFTGTKVAPGVALQFIYLLRLLGGSANPLIQKLYQSQKNPDLMFKLLNKILPVVMPGWAYPEAKIIGELVISNEIAKFSSNNCNLSEFHHLHQEALLNAIELKNIKAFRAMLHKGYASAPYFSIYEPIFRLISKNSVRLRFIAELIKHHVDQITSSEQDKSPLHLAFDKYNGDLSIIDCLLSTPHPDADEPLLARLPNPNLQYTRTDRNYMDIVDHACAVDTDGSLLNRLKKAHADFIKMGKYYLRTTVQAWAESKQAEPTAAIVFLHQEGVQHDRFDQYGKSALMVAAELGHLESAEYLISHMGAKPDVPLKIIYQHPFIGLINYDPDNGKTALHFAVESSKVKLVRYLLSVSANPHLRTINGRLPIDLIPDQPSARNEQIRELLSSAMQLSNEPITKLDATPLSSLHKVVAMVIGQDSNGRAYVVLGKRYHDHQKTNNDYCFPGGAAEADDACLMDAVVRELREETSIALDKVPEVQCRELMSTDQFYSQDHDSTTFFLFNIGQAPINLYACDDLIEVNKIYIDELHYDPKQSIAKRMSVSDRAVLGSNALVLTYYMAHPDIAFNEEEQKTISEQLYIEAQGYEQLCSHLARHSPDCKPGSTAWDQAINMLENNAHLSPRGDYASENSLVLNFLRSSPIEGCTLLHQYGVDLFAHAQFFIFKQPDGTFSHGNVLHYAAAMNDMSLLQHLFTLGYDVRQHHPYNYLAMVQAAEFGHKEIVLELLDRGINPNLTHESNPRIGGKSYKPLISTAIKSHQNDLVNILLTRPEVFINQERTERTNENALMTALLAKNKEAAKRLLASCRMNLNYLSKETKLSALQLATTNGWQDIIDIMSFLTQFPDADAYANHHGYNLMQVCQTSNETNLVDFLLVDLKDSIFWKTRNEHLRTIQQNLVNDILKFLSFKQLLCDKYFPTELQFRNYYQQIIRECTSLKHVQLSLELSSDGDDFTIKALQQHQYVKRLTLTDICLPSTSCTNPRLDRYCHLLDSLPNLSELKLEHLSFSDLIKMLDFVGMQAKTTPIPISIVAYYTDEQHAILINIVKNNQLRNPLTLVKANELVQVQLDECIEHNTIQHYAETLPEFKDTYDKIQKLQSQEQTLISHNLSTKLVPHPHANYILHRCILSQSGASSSLTGLTINPLLFSLVYQNIKSSKRLESINMEYSTPDPLLLFRAIIDSPSKLSSLVLPGIKLDEKATLLLIRLINNKPLKYLNFSSSKLNDISLPKVSLLLESLANHPHLEVLIMSSMTINKKSVADEHVAIITRSKSLLDFQYTRMTFFMGANKQRIKTMTERNAKLQLQQVSALSFFAQSTKDVSTQPFGSDP